MFCKFLVFHSHAGRLCLLSLKIFATRTRALHKPRFAPVYFPLCRPTLCSVLHTTGIRWQRPLRFAQLTILLAQLFCTSLVSFIGSFLQPISAFFAANLGFFCSQSRVFCSQSRVGNSTGGQHYYLPKYQTCHSTRIKSELQIHFVVFFSFAFEMWLPGACKGCQEPRKRQNSEVLVNIYFQLIINVHHRTFALFIFYYFLFFPKIILSLIVAICANKIRVFLFFYISSWSSLGLLDILLLGSISAGGSSSTSSSYLETWQLFLPPMCLQRGSDKGDESTEQEGDRRKLKAVTCIRDPLVERSAVCSVMPFAYPFGWGLRTSNEE